MIADISGSGSHACEGLEAKKRAACAALCCRRRLINAPMQFRTGFMKQEKRKATKGLGLVRKS
jgi:hypothetical protein